MSYLSYTGVGILGMASAVPSKIFDNLKDNVIFSAETAEKMVDKSGVKQRRIADDKVCASDLCQAAAEKLLSEMNIERSEIDVLIVNTQTPDYKTPGTSNVLQHKLGLTKGCATYDINLGASGFMLGLSMAYSLLSQDSIRYILLLCGDTGSKAFSFSDKTTGFIFGDAGSACLIGKSGNAGLSHFIFSSDASKKESIMIKAGGYRNPSSLETLQEKTYSDGSKRSDEKCSVDLESIEEFTKNEIHRHYDMLFEYSGISLKTVDFILPHALYKSIIELMMEGLNNQQNDKVLSSLEQFGDTGSASFPLAVSLHLRNKINENPTVLFSGLGAGLSLGSAIIKLKNIHISEVTEV